MLILGCIQHPSYCKDPQVWLLPHFYDYYDFTVNKPYEREKRTLRYAVPAFGEVK